MRVFLDFIRRPLVSLMLLPALFLPMASLIITPLLKASHVLPPILEMIATQGLTTLLAATAFYLVRGREETIDASRRTLEQLPLNWFWDVLLPIFIILVAVNKFYLTSVSWDIGPHRFFDELGLDAAYVERLFQGDVYFRDCIMIYNVLMFWPVYMLMKIFGHQLWVLQGWTLVLELICFGGLYAALRFLTEDRWLSLIGLGLCVFLFYPDVPYPHASYSRYHLGLFPGLIMAWSLRRGNKSYWVGGLAAAVYFFYTYDYGLVSCAAMTLSVLFLFPKERIKSISTTLGWLLPVVLFFLWLIKAVGGVGPALNALFYFPLHYHAVDIWWPFPELGHDTLTLIFHPSGSTVRAWMLSQLAHGPYLIYALCFLGLWFGPLSRARPEKRFLACYLLIFAWSCAPKYIFRTGYLLTGTHLYLAPAVLLAFWIMAEWGRSAENRTEPRFLSGWLLLVLLGYLRCHWAPAMTARLASNPFVPHASDAPTGYLPLRLPSAKGIYVPAEWVERLETLQSRLANSTANGRDLYVFPYDPMWYFLLEKKNAGISDITGNVLPGGWASVLESVERSHPSFILLSNFAQKPEPSPEVRRRLEGFLGTSYVEEWSDSTLRLYRKANKS